MSDHPNLARMRGRIGGYAVHARYDSKQLTAAARASFLAGFERQVDPEGVLDPAERATRAMRARKAYFASLAFKKASKRALQLGRERLDESSEVPEPQEREHR